MSETHQFATLQSQITYLIDQNRQLTDKITLLEERLSDKISDLDDRCKDLEDYVKNNDMEVVAGNALCCAEEYTDKEIGEVKDQIDDINTKIRDEVQDQINTIKMELRDIKS
jgi:hypothetical protein